MVAVAERGFRSLTGNFRSNTYTSESPSRRRNFHRTSETRFGLPQVRTPHQPSFIPVAGDFERSPAHELRESIGPIKQINLASKRGPVTELTAALHAPVIAIKSRRSRIFMICRTSKMSHGYGWRGSCAAGDV